MNYLIIRNDGIGDLIVSTCGIGKLREIDKKSNITLICSNRNIEYAKILRNDGHIDRLFNLDRYRTFSEKIKIISKLRRLSCDHVFILKSNWKNLILSLIIKSKNIHAINPSKINKLSGRKSYKYPLLFSNLIFKSIEIINSTDIQTSDTKIRMGSHYRELFNKALNLKKSNLEYIKPNSFAEFENNTKKIFSSLNMNKKNTVLFHLDEKWYDLNISKEFLIKLFDSIIASDKKIKLVVTNGKYINVLNNNIYKHYKLKKIKTKNHIYQSQKNRKIFFIKKSNISELIGIVSNVSLIFHLHGSITHISSILKIPIVDIIRNDLSKYFYKWRPNFDEYTQIEIKNLKNPQKYIKKYL